MEGLSLPTEKLATTISSYGIIDVIIDDVDDIPSAIKFLTGY